MTTSRRVQAIRCRRVPASHATHHPARDFGEHALSKQLSTHVCTLELVSESYQTSDVARQAPGMVDKLADLKRAGPTSGEVLDLLGI